MVNEGFWIVISAIASAAVAIATGFLAFFTYDLAKETRQSLVLSRQGLDDERAARRSEEQRHMDGFMPHVALIAKEELLELAGQGIRQRFPALYLKNIGVGFAHNIRTGHLNAAKPNEFYTYPPPIALGVGEEVLLAAKDTSNGITFMGYTVTYEDRGQISNHASTMASQSPPDMCGRVRRDDTNLNRRRRYALALATRLQSKALP